MKSQKAEELKPFSQEDIEDVKIIIKAKGKHWSIVPLEDMDKDEVRQIRIELMRVILQLHSVIDTPLEEVKEKLKQQS